MSSQAAPSATSTIDLNDPRLHTPQPDYSAIRFNADGSPYLADRFLNLPPAMQLYVLALARLGPEGIKIAERVANCCRSAHVSCRCIHGKFARAHKHHCGDHYCATDSSPRYKFNKWAMKRDHRVFRMPHAAIEITLRKPKPYATHIGTAQSLRHKANRLLRELTPDSLSVEVFRERTEDMSVRAVFPGSGHSYNQLKAALVKLDLADTTVATVKRGTTEELFHWVFAGFFESAAMNPGTKAMLRVLLISHHTVAILGKLYKELTKEELEARRSCAPEKCPICKDHDLEVIPFDSSHSERVEDIEDQYESIDWSREHLSPFIIRKGDSTDKSGNGKGDVITFVPETPSPPS